jgi:hypothetical protein
VDANSRSRAGGRRQRYFRYVRIAVTVAAFAYLASRVEPLEVVRAWRKLSVGAGLSAIGLVIAGLGLGVVRWRALLVAYGAIDIPRWSRMGHLYLVGHFYNTYAPGGVGGDVVRGVASRLAFGDLSWAGATRGVAVVFVERVCGVVALLTLAAGAYLIWPIAGVQHVELAAVLGLLAAAAAVSGIAVAPRIARYLPEKLGKPFRALPDLRAVLPFVWAIVLSLLIHFLSILAIHVIMESLFPPVKLSESAVVVPLITASVFFPLTVGGAGVREAMFATLYGAVGVPEAIAYAGSLSIWAAQLITAGIGGVINLVVPLSGVDRDSAHGG